MTRPRVAGRVARSALLLGALLGGCAKDSVVFVPRPDAPEGIAWGAVLVAAGDGALLAATGLEPWSPGHPLRLDGLKIPESSTVELLGWTDAELRAAPVPTADRLAASPLAEASGCAPRLPEASFGARFDQAGHRLDSLPTPRALTAEWLSGACPELADALSINVRCMVRGCAGFTTQRGCALTIDLENCTEGVHQAMVDWRGRLCGVSSSKPACAFVEPRAPALGSIDCGEPDPCTVDLYVPPDEPAYSVETAPVVPGVPPRTARDVETMGVRAWTPLTGYTAGLAWVGGRLAVATHDGRFLERPECSEPATTRTVFLDPDTLARLGEAETPPCLRNLLSLPGAPGFLGVSGSPDARSLLELDDEGRVLRAHPLELPEPERHAYDDLDLRLARDERRLLVLFRRRAAGGGARGTVILELMRDTYAQRVLYQAATGAPGGFAESDDSVLAVTDEESDTVELVDANTGRGALTPITLFHVSSISTGQIAWFAPTRSMLVPIAYAEELMHVVSLGGVTDAWSPFYERSAGPLITTPWPADPELVLTGAAYTRPGAVRDAWLSLFEPRTRRFFPGATRLGHGTPGRMLTEGGRVWVTIPWEGRIARVTPR